MNSVSWIMRNLVFILINFVVIKSQKQCFSRNSMQSINISQAQGPLKYSLTDPLKDFESGSYTIMNAPSLSLKRYSCFNLTLKYINPEHHYEVVGSIQNIENYRDNQGIDFSVRLSPAQTVIQCLFIMSHTATWTSANIHYIISSRQDFRVGTFLPESIDFLPCGKSSEQSTLEYRLLRGWNASDQLVFGLTFLSGIRTIDTELNVTFGKSTFDTNKSLLKVPVNFAQVQYPIQYMLISYMIVTMSSDFQITNIYDLDYIPDDINVFVGMTGIRLAPQQLRGLKSTTSISNILSKTMFQQFFGVQGLVIQSSSTLDILFSDGEYSSQTILYCISPQKCEGYDGYMKYYQNENGYVFHSECVLCEKFASYNYKTQKCECRDLYVRINDECVAKEGLCDSKKGENFNQTTGKCQCMNGYALKNNICVPNISCPQGFTLFKGKCYKLTTKTSSPSTPLIPSQPATEISCPSPSFYNQSCKCCSCQSPLHFEQTSKKCLSCGQNQVYNPKAKVCVCMEGAFKINGKCDFCSVNGFFNGKSCQCLPRYLGNGKICRPDSKFIDQTLLKTGNLANSQGKILQEQNTLNKETQDVSRIIIGNLDPEANN